MLDRFVYELLSFCLWKLPATFKNLITLLVAEHCMCPFIYIVYLVMEDSLCYLSYNGMVFYLFLVWMWSW